MSYNGFNNANDNRVMAVAAPVTELRQGRVRVTAGDQTDVRSVQLAEGRDGWPGWAKQITWNLQNLAFVDIGDAVYRSATVDRVEPITDDNADPVDLALQAALAVLTMIRDVEMGDFGPRELAAEMLQSMEHKGITLRDS